MKKEPPEKSNVTEMPKKPEIKMGVIVPEELWQQMKDWAKEYVPTGKTELLWPSVKALRPQEITLLPDEE